MIKKPKAQTAKPKPAAKKPKGKPGRPWVRDADGICKPTTPRQLLDWRKAEMATLDLEVRRGELVERDAVDRANRATAQMIQTDLQGMGRRLAPLLVGRDIVQIQTALDSSVREMLNQWRRFPDGNFKE